MKKIKIITFTIAILGLISELWGFMDIELSNIQIEQILYFNSLKSLNLSYFNLDLFGYLDVESGYLLNYFNRIKYLVRK